VPITLIDLCDRQVRPLCTLFSPALLVLCVLSVFFRMLPSHYFTRPRAPYYWSTWSPKSWRSRADIVFWRTILPPFLFSSPRSLRNGCSCTRGSLSLLWIPGRVSLREELRILSRSQSNAWNRNRPAFTWAEHAVFCHTQNTDGKER